MVIREDKMRQGDESAEISKLQPLLEKTGL